MDKNYYTELPESRVESFFWTIKRYYKDFLLYGLISLLFLIPLYLSPIIFGNISNDINLNESLTIEQKEASLFKLELVKYLINIILFIVFSFVVAGLIRVLRQHAFFEFVSGSDFVKGIKLNAIHTAILFFIVGICYTIVSFFINMAVSYNTSTSFLIAIVSLGFFLLCIVPVSLFLLVGISLYANKFKNLLITSLYILSKTFFKSILFIIICFSPLLLLLVPNIVYSLILKVLVSFLLPFMLYGWYLYALSAYDKYFNDYYHKDLYRKGLKKLNEEEEIK